MRILWLGPAVAVPVAVLIVLFGWGQTGTVIAIAVGTAIGLILDAVVEKPWKAKGEEETG